MGTSMQLTISDIERARELKDPALINSIVTLARQSDPEPEVPIRDEALTFDRFIRTISSYDFRQKPDEEQRAYRVEQMRLLEADDAEVALPERLKLHKVILELWSDSSYYSRIVLIDIIRHIPLKFGPWRALKHIYKASEASNDYQLSGEISARFDTATEHEFSQATLVYMRRRAWRHLRKLGESLPVCYPEAVIHYLAAYPEDTQWSNTWVANHIFHHQSKSYGISRFGHISGRNNLLKNRAFAEVWKRSPEPLLRLLNIARSEFIRNYACDALKQDFAVVLRNVEPRWIVDLAALPVASPAIDGFIIWLLQSSPKLEQHQFRSLGLHDSVIGLLESKDNTARQYAIAYVKAHARDLPLAQLLELAGNNDKQISQLVQQLLSERDPRNAVGLEVWGQLLEFDRHYDFTAKVLRKHFGRKELTPQWFSERLIAASGRGQQFSQDTLLELYPAKTLGIDYFREIAEQLDPENPHASEVTGFIFEQMEQLGVADLPAEFLQFALLHPLYQWQVSHWIDNDIVKANVLPLNFYQALVFEPEWAEHALIKQFRQSDVRWQQNLSFDEGIADGVSQWLSDVRRFSPGDLGFEWLMKLVNREEPTYHDFAVELMIKAFVPADFAVQGDASDAEDEPVEAAGEIDKTIDLEQQTFLFTGKMKTMPRGDAQKVVTAANGKNVGTVTKNLNYLVIGDEGSPMYGNGRKGSKQVKAESLMAAGADLKVMSETAFLQMMAGEQREFSEDSIEEGCKTLWTMALDEPDTPVSKFAIKYIRYHHPELCLKLTDRPVDPGAEIPDSFATFERFKTMFSHAHTPLRQLALDYAEYEFARWEPVSAELIKLCESKYSEVSEFVAKALLEEPDAENKRYNIDATLLDAGAVYSFCESRNPPTRQLGMQIIQKYEKFQLPESLFLLTESPDRELRGFVVRILWSLYRNYATTTHWKPELPVMPGMSKADLAKREAAEKNLGMGLPVRPENLPADKETLQTLLQRWLYELPPGRLSGERLENSLKPLSASAAKKALIETFRDVALDDIEFAKMVLPLFRNFTQSRGAMEQAACLVAVTRIQHSHPELVGV
uniref:BRCT domain-containing protein n=1 Tax=uncultured Thiotrichaceae bacterium TaxID=298394 RepID=A0A6S6UMH5_9GAMM|nr:MAG: Unknown protein [uncultured Thiotrichaceae bacterium]